jgi:hypothetical protein
MPRGAATKRSGLAASVGGSLRLATTRVRLGATVGSDGRALSLGPVGRAAGAQAARQRHAMIETTVHRNFIRSKLTS